MLLFADQSPDLVTGSEAFTRLHVESLLLPVLVQLLVIVGVARIAGVLGRKLGQPTAVGEVIAGLLLGPSLFGWLCPEASAWLFQPHFEGVPDAIANAAVPKIFQVFSQVGLIFLLFLIGLEFDFEHLRETGRSALIIAVCGIVIPFLMGVGLAPLVHPHLEPHPIRGAIPLFGLTLFMGIAMTITAIPTLGRIMIELGINRTKLGTTVIIAAAIGDAIGWVLLAAISAVTKAAFDPVEAATMIVLTIAFSLAMVYIVRPVLSRYLNWSMEQTTGTLHVPALTVLLVVILLCAVATNLIGIFAIFGPFLLGAVLSDQHRIRDAVLSQMKDLVIVFFVPIFFTYSGLRTEIGSITGLSMWLMLLTVVLVGIISKFGGCMVAARITGLRWKESAIIGALMNTRGLMELIVINVGYDLGVIPKSLFCMLVVMAIVTTIMTTPALLLLRRGTEIEIPIEKSGFLGSNAKA